MKYDEREIRVNHQPSLVICREQQSKFIHTSMLPLHVLIKAVEPFGHIHPLPPLGNEVHKVVICFPVAAIILSFYLAFAFQLPFRI